VRNNRQALTRLIAYMYARGLDWEDRFGTLVEIDLFAFLMEVHVEAIVNGTTSRPGFGAVWGDFPDIHYLSPHFNLPTEEVRSSFTRGFNTGLNRSSRPLFLCRLPLWKGCAITPQTHGHHL